MKQERGEISIEITQVRMNGTSRRHWWEQLYIAFPGLPSSVPAPKTRDTIQIQMHIIDYKCPLSVRVFSSLIVSLV